MKFEVGDFDACKDGISKVEADIGPIDILVNNAGITRDKPLHKMDPEHWEAVNANQHEPRRLKQNFKTSRGQPKHLSGPTC